jgi:hypothetical protein
VENGFHLKPSLTLTVVEGRDRHLVHQMLFECVLIGEISIAIVVMELTDVDRGS